METRLDSWYVYIYMCARRESDNRQKSKTYPWQSPLLMQRVLGADCTVTAVVGQKGAAWNQIDEDSKLNGFVLIVLFL